MKYTIDTHYSRILINNPIKDLDTKNCKRYRPSITSDFIPIEVKYKNQDCWLLKGELEIIESLKLTLDNIKFITYIEGTKTPFGGHGHSISSVDGYVMDFIFEG